MFSKRRLCGILNAVSSCVTGLNNADSRPKLVAGSPEGYPGHVDGRLREAKMNHPKGFTVDGRGNIYVADAMNMAVRKISDTGKLKCLVVYIICTWFCLFSQASYVLPFGFVGLPQHVFITWHLHLKLHLEG